jgi:hypothetical protein
VKGTRPDLLFGRLSPSASRPSTPAGSGGGDIVVAHGSACPEGQRTQRTREIKCRGRRSDEVGSSLLETAQKIAAVREHRGNPGFEHRVCGAAQRIPKAECVAPAGAMVATSSVPTSCG